MNLQKRSYILLKLAICGLAWIGLGYALPVLQAQTEPPQPTPYASIFDAMTDAPPATPTAAEQSAGQAVPPTRIPSIFDATQGVPSVPTRILSIFDAPTGGEAGQPTRVPSIFDAQPGAQPTGQAPGQPTPFTSMFGAVQVDVIRFEGEELPDQAYCLSCHENPFLQMVLPSGEALPVTVDETAYMNSIHGQHGTEGYRCIRCHEGMNAYPHDEITAATARELIIDYSTSCARCHPNNYDETLDGVHLELLATGNENAAVCADCHSGHAIQPLNDEITGDPLPGSGITSVEMCTSCHAEVYEHYAASVHGRALVEGNDDVPTCADCHGIHNIEGPSESAFRLFSPQTCAECHADAQLMAEYEISTNVFDTYVADFHGTTVMIFQATAPDQEFNAPVCVDCHGAHAIMAVDEASSPVLKENLLVTCRRCHPNASSDFPEAWLSHYPPSFGRTPVVALADTIYTILIPAMIGGLGLFVLTDIYRRFSDRRKER